MAIRPEVMKLTMAEYTFIGLCVEGFLYGKISHCGSCFKKCDIIAISLRLGLYSGIFAMYLQHHSSKKGTHGTKNILFFSLCVLYVLSVATVITDMAVFIYGVSNKFCR